MSATASALVLSWVAILALAFVAAGLFERVSALERMVGPNPGLPSSGIRHLPEGAPFAPAGRPLVLVVASPTCTGCAQLVPELGVLTELGVDVRLLWENAEGASGPVPVETAVITAQEAAQLGATATPFALVADEQGEVAWSGAVADIDRLIELTEPVRRNLEDQP